MRDPADTRTFEIEAFPLPKTPGRKRVYASAADRQKAYRDRKRSGQVQALSQVSDLVPERRAQPETVTKNVTATSRAELLAQLQVIADRDNEIARLRAQVQALQADNAELMQRLDRAETARDQYRRSFELSQQREFETRKQCDEKIALAQSRMDRLMDDLQRREAELAAAQSKPKKCNVTKKGKGANNS
jgi:chromosome segregation ATPase